MNKNILIPDIQNFINENLHADLNTLLLKKSPFPEVSMPEIVQQIKGRKVAEKKFPFLLKDNIVFPPNLSLEQASSEATGIYKNRLVKGQSMVDLTCGFGIDAWFLSQNFEQITLIEQNQDLISTVQHNWEILGRKAAFINKKFEDFLDENKSRIDLLYLDPARRDENRNKVFLLEDLSPNLLEIQDKLFKISDKILIKLSPLIDISYLISTLNYVAAIHIVAVKNDVKELLVLLDKSLTSIPKIHCINLETEEPEFSFKFNEIVQAEAEFSSSKKYLYLPNNAILKSGAFNLICQKFSLEKLHPNTHLYTSESLLEAFPGRILEVEAAEPKQLEKNAQFNIISKNYPLKPEDIKKKYKLRDGGHQYLIFTQDFHGKVVLKSK